MGELVCKNGPFDDRGRALQDVIRALTFRESEDSDLLIVTQVADRDVVHLLMRNLLAYDEDVVGISLDASEWHRLIALDLVSAGDIGTTSMPRPNSRSTGQSLTAGTTLSANVVDLRSTTIDARKVGARHSGPASSSRRRPPSVAPS